MSSFSMAVPWLEYVIAGTVIGGFLTFIAWRIISHRRRGNAEDPLPRLDREPRAATVVAVHPARRREHARRRRQQESTGSDDAVRDAWLIEVEYVDSSGSRRRALLADVIPTSALDRFSSGAMCRVYAFSVPQTHFQKGSADGALPTERCLLTEEHGGILRAGINLDGVRAKVERQHWVDARTGSPFLGVMAFITDGDRWQGEVIGSRTSFPGDPRAAWARASTGPVAALTRPREVPRPETVAEVAKWEDPNGFTRTELYYAPSFWVFLPVVALGFLIWGTITDPGDGWTGNLFDDDVSGDPWNFWLVWVGVSIWLLIAIGVLVLRVSVTSEVRADNEWIYQKGVPVSIHRSPYNRAGGEAETWPTFIGIDHRVSDETAARIHHALYAWLSSHEVQGELDSGALRERPVIASEELFGDQAAGGYYIDSIPGFGSDNHFAAHQWVLLTEPRDPDASEMSVTTIPLEETREKIRKKLRRKARA